MQLQGLSKINITDLRIMMRMDTEQRDALQMVQLKVKHFMFVLMESPLRYDDESFRCPVSSQEFASLLYFQVHYFADSKGYRPKTEVLYAERVRTIVEKPTVYIGMFLQNFVSD